MIYNELEPAAWTPELGGDFENLKLKLQYLSNIDIREAILKNKGIDAIGMVDVNISSLTRIELLADAVLDWENMFDGEGKAVVFVKAKNRKDIKNFLSLKTGIKIADTENCYSLEGYIEKFCLDRENFLKNCVGTASSGCAGGSSGNPGKKKNG